MNGGGDARAVLEQAYRAGLIDATVAQRALGVLARTHDLHARLAALQAAGVPGPVLERLAALGTLSGSALLRKDSLGASSPGAAILGDGAPVPSAARPAGGAEERAPAGRAQSIDVARSSPGVAPVPHPARGTPPAGASAARATGARGIVNLPGAAPSAGQRLGPFTIEAELGRGGMGAVFKARGDDGRVAAVKVMLAGGSATAGKRFEREANALRALSHDNVVRFMGAGSEPPPSWIAMEFVEGRDLSKVLEEGALAFDEAAALVAQVARGVAHAHEHGIMHRDLKPQNVLVRARDGAAVVTDFGLARELDASRHTKTGAMVGTMAYMSPEQLRGDREVAEPTDAWALGAILYRCLTGQDPFTAPTALELSKEIVESPVVPPRRVVKEVPADLEAVALACLQRDPARRPTAAAIADALEARRALGGARRAGRGKLALALAGCGLVAIAVALRGGPRAEGVATTTTATATTTDAPTTGAPTTDAPVASEAPAVAAPVPDDPPALRARAQAAIDRAGQAVLGPTPEDARGPLDEALDLLGRAIELAPSDVATRLMRGKLAERLDRTRLAQDDLERVLELVDDGPLAGEAAYLLARIENYKDATQRGGLRPRIARARERAAEPWAAILAAFELVIDERAPAARDALAPAQARRAALASEQPAAAVAIDWLEDRIRSELERPDRAPIERAIAADPTDTWAHLRRAATRFALGDAAGSLEDARRVLALAPGHLDARSRRYQALRVLGRPEEALADARAIIDEYDLQTPKPLNDLAMTLHHAALLCETLDRPAESDVLLERIRELNPPDVRPTLTRAVRLVDRGDPAGAFDLVLDAARALPPDAPLAYRICLSTLLRSIALGSGQGERWRAVGAETDPEDVRAESDLELGDLEGCLARCEALLAREPRHESALRLRLLARVRAAPDRARALEEVERFLPDAQGRPLMLAVAASALVELGLFDRAEPVARAAIDRGGGGSFIAWRTLGAARLGLGDPEGALDALVRGTTINPMDVQGGLLEARAKLALGAVGAAELDAHGAATLGPYDRDALGFLLPLLLRPGRVEEVARFANRLETMERARRPAPAPARLAVAEALLALDAAARAEGLVRSVLAERPDDPDARVLEADLLAARGERNRARSIVDDVLVRHPEHAKARAARERLAR